MRTYKEKLLSPKWQKKRLEIMQRAEFQCEFCGEKDLQLQIHHGYYERGLEPWEYSSETLYCLCVACHETIQEQLRDVCFEIAKRNQVLSMVMNAIIDVEYGKNPKSKKLYREKWFNL